MQPTLRLLHTAAMDVVTTPEPRPRPLRRGLRRLGLALVVYGILGIIVSAIACGATIWANNRVTSMREDAQLTVARAAGTIDAATLVLRGASTTVDSFAATVDQSASAISTAAGTMTETHADLIALEAQLRSVSIFGATPLASPADSVGRIAASMDGLDAQLALIAESGKTDRNALAGTSTALANLADSTHEFADNLALGAGGGSFSDVQMVIAMTLLAVAAWSFVPAVGAIVLGLWLRRTLSRPLPTSPAIELGEPAQGA